MIDSKELKELLFELLAGDFEHPFVYGHGIITEQQTAFDKEVLEKNKAYIANVLKEIGVEELSYITLERLTKLKDGETWNELQTKEEFETLELLLSCSDACGFIDNGILAMQRNEFELGSVSSILTSDFGERWNNGITDEWLCRIREEIITKMRFKTNAERINEYDNSGDALADRPLAKRIVEL